MSNLRLNLPTEPTHEAWVKHLAANVGRTGRIGHNTYASVWEMGKDASVSIRYHNTIIVEFYKDGRIRLNSGGWRTSTTKNRLNLLLFPYFGVQQKDYEWVVWKRIGGKWVEWLPFEDGMTLMVESDARTV